MNIGFIGLGNMGQPMARNIARAGHKLTINTAQAGCALDEAQDRAGQRPTEPVERGAHTNKWAVLGLVAVGTFMTTLDAAIVNISLPSIARTFHTPVGGAVEWVIIAYLVLIAATLLPCGRVSDLIGRKPVWMAGLGLFTLGSAPCNGRSSAASAPPSSPAPYVWPSASARRLSGVMSGRQPCAARTTMHHESLRKLFHELLH
jgi:hypothetical protein